MKPDENMISDAMDLTSGKGKEAMRERIEAYRIACHLAGGRNPVRSRYWQEKAARMAFEIKRLTPSQKAPGVGKEQCA